MKIWGSILFGAVAHASCNFDSTSSDCIVESEGIIDSFQTVKVSEVIGLTSVDDGSYTPVVQMHGMGDFASNPAGMVPLKEDISKRLNGAYVTNVQIGESAFSDQLNGFFMNMDDQVDHFHQTVSSDVNLSQGFNAIGYSQGNNIIRGYIERYNNPPVKNWISMHGPLMGVAGLPNCNATHFICDKVDGLLQLGAYTGFVQNHLAQANYLRDPKDLGKYRAKGRFLADINNEKSTTNSTYSTNLASVSKIVTVRAMADTMVEPSWSEWWGFYADGSRSEIVEMVDSDWYKEDWYGLKELNEAGGLEFLSTPGNHLQFDTSYLLTLVDKYLTN